jgi:hypothetical protein
VFLLALLFAATGVVTWQFARQQPAASLSYSSAKSDVIILDQPSELPEPKSAVYESFFNPGAARPGYPYSVIPGGIADAEDLRTAMGRDPVVAREFAGFDFQRAHLLRVSENQLMHVAYRMGDKIFWTRKKVPLHRGETLISDGKIVARTRCGNRVATVPLGPPALVDPLLSDIDQPIFSNDIVTPEVEPQHETYEGAFPVTPPADAKTLRPVKRKRAVPFFILPFFGLPGGGSSHTPLAVAPEPAVSLLFSSGLLGIYWKTRKRRRKR